MVLGVAPVELDGLDPGLLGLAGELGAELARKAKEAGVETVKFDRGHSKYHGRVKAFADAAREGGLRF